MNVTKKTQRILLIVAMVALAAGCDKYDSESNEFNGLSMGMGNLPRLSNAKTRSINNYHMLPMRN